MPADQTHVRVAPVSDLIRGKFLRATVSSRDILITRLPDGSLAAFDLGCPHQGHHMSRGELSPEGDIECPHHFYAYDVTTGRNTWPGDGEIDEPLAIHEAVERDGEIFVRLQSAP